MDRKNRASSVSKNQSALKIVWSALLLAMFAYTAVVFVFKSPEAPDVRENVKAAFLLGGAVLGVISLLIYKFTLSEKSLRKKFLSTQGQEPGKRLEELYDDEDHATAIANGTKYGLVASCWTRDGARQLRMAR